MDLMDAISGGGAAARTSIRPAGTFGGIGSMRNVMAAKVGRGRLEVTVE